MSKLRLAMVATPRSGNTWLSQMLAGYFALPRRAVHELSREAIRELPDEAIVQIHWRREPDFVARLEDAGFQIVTLARHPFDTLISILHVAVYDVESENWLGGRGGDETSLWAATPRSRTFIDYCRGPRAMELLNVTADYWDRPEVFCARYEDLVNDPRPTLAAAAERFGPARISPEQVEALLASLSLDAQRKTSVNNHFWKGQPGLWRELIPATEANEMGEVLRPLIEKLGYSVDPKPETDAASADSAWVQMVGTELGTTLRQNTAGHRAQLAEAGAATVAAQAAAEAATAQLARQSATLVAAISERDAARAEAERVAETVSGLRADLAGVRSELETARTNLAQATVATENHWADLNLAQAAADAHRAEVAKLQSTLTDARHERAQLVAAADELRIQVVRVTNAHEQTAKELGRQITILEERLTATDRRRQAVELHMAAVEEFNLALTSEANRYRRLQGFSLRLAERTQDWRDRTPWLFNRPKAVMRRVAGWLGRPRPA